jgi:hypothetical protein
VYEVRAVDETGQVVSIATTDKASDALTKIRDSVASYRRIWVQDETGGDMSIQRLLARADEEGTDT